jgi:hypothetical protein
MKTYFKIEYFFGLKRFLFDSFWCINYPIIILSIYLRVTENVILIHWCNHNSYRLKRIFTLF